MAASTAPMLLVGGISYANQVIGNGHSWDSELIIPVAAAVAAGILAVVEKGNRPLAVGVAWIAVVTALVLPPRNGRAAVTNAIRLTGLGAHG